MSLVLRLMLEPQQGGTYQQFLRLAHAAEDAGWDALFRSDHLLTIGGASQPALEAWTTLAALARDTTRIRLGTLVSPATFRHPSVFAREVATVDELSGGRVEAGLGTGWFEAEHRTLGIPFPPQGERTARLAEFAEVVTRLWTGEPVSFSGRYYSLEDAHALPRPVQRPLPIVLGGHGGPRSTALAARLAAEYNTTSAAPAAAAQTYRKVREACERAGRDPGTLRLSWMGTVLVAPDQASLRRRAARIAAWSGNAGEEPDAVLARIAERSVVGTPERAAERLREYADAGAERVYARVWDLDDLDQLTEIAALAG